MPNPFDLYDWQAEVLGRMKNGCILCGGVGSGKSRTALAYYFKTHGGYFCNGIFKPMDSPVPLYIITTATKRNKKEWHQELIPFEMSVDGNPPVVIDSWNNVKKYTKVKDAFFIFDEQRVISSGAWSKSFIKIAHQNQWILLTATPGDVWNDYAAVFIANGFYRNFTQFRDEHVSYIHIPNVSYAPIDHQHYRNVFKLIKEKEDILVDMDYHRPTEIHEETLYVDYDKILYRSIGKFRRDPWTDEPIENASAMCFILRKIANSAPGRKLAILDIVEEHPKVIIFYNYNYERDILRELPYPSGTVVAELSGHQHDPVPDSERWVYLVNYGSGAEGWNCITTDTMIFFSQNYSYKTMVQAMGRIDRVNTKFKDLYYYHIKTKAPIDLAIARALQSKKNFSEGRYFSKI